MYSLCSPLLDQGPPEMFVTDPTHVLTTLNLPDISYFTSKIMMGHRNTSNDLMSRHLFHSLVHTT